MFIKALTYRGDSIYINSNEILLMFVDDDVDIPNCIRIIMNSMVKYNIYIPLNVNSRGEAETKLNEFVDAINIVNGFNNVIFTPNEYHDAYELIMGISNDTLC